MRFNLVKKLAVVAFTLLLSTGIKAQTKLFYQKAWIAEIGAGSTLISNEEDAPVQMKLGIGYEVAFEKPEILGLAIKMGICRSKGFDTKPIEQADFPFIDWNSGIPVDIPSNQLKPLYDYTANSFYLGVTPMLILEQDGALDRIYLELELGLANHSADITIYSPERANYEGKSYCKGYFSLKAGMRFGGNEENFLKGVSLWGALHNTSPITAINDAIPNNWQYSFTEDLKSQWQIGLSVYF